MYKDMINKYFENIEFRKESQKNKEKEEEKVIELNKYTDILNIKWS